MLSLGTKVSGESQKNAVVKNQSQSLAPRSLTLYATTIYSDGEALNWKTVESNKKGTDREIQRVETTLPRDDTDPAVEEAAYTGILTDVGEDSMPVVEGISTAEHRAEASGGDGGDDVVVVVEEDEEEDSADTLGISVQ